MAPKTKRPKVKQEVEDTIDGRIEDYLSNLEDGSFEFVDEVVDDFLSKNEDIDKDDGRAEGIIRDHHLTEEKITKKETTLYEQTTDISLICPAFNPKKDIVTGLGVKTPLPDDPEFLGVSCFGTSKLTEVIADYCPCGTPIGIHSYKIAIYVASGRSYTDFATHVLKNRIFKMCCLNRIMSPTVVNIASEDIGSRRTHLLGSDIGSVENSPPPTMKDVSRTWLNVPDIV